MEGSRDDIKAWSASGPDPPPPSSRTVAAHLPPQASIGLLSVRAREQVSRTRGTFARGSAPAATACASPNAGDRKTHSARTRDAELAAHTAVHGARLTTSSKEGAA